MVMEIFIPSLNGGEISDLLGGRGDFKQRQYGGSTVENFLPLVQGPIVGRPGTTYINSVYNSSNRAHLIGMNTASGSSYMIEMSNYVMRFYKSGALLSGSNKTVSTAGGNAAVTFTDVGDWVNWTGHGLPLYASVKFTTTLTLPTGITAGTTYYVYAVETNRFQISAAPNGEQLTFTGTGSGTMTGYHNLLTTSSEHGFNFNDLITISGATGSAPLINGDYCVKGICGPYATVTISNASPNVVTWTGHGLAAGDPVVFRTSGSLTGNLVAGTTYYVKTVLTSDTFTVSLTNGGAVISGGAASSGTQGALALTNYNRFEIHTVDGVFDFLVGDKDISTYTALAGSPVAKFIGKMHPYSSAYLFDSNNRFDVGCAGIGDSMFFANKNSWPIKLTVNSDYDWTIVRHRHGSYTHTDGTIYSYFDSGPWVRLEKDNSTKIEPQTNNKTGSDCVIKTWDGSELSTKNIFAPTDIGRLVRCDPQSGNSHPSYYIIKAYTSASEVNTVRLEDSPNTSKQYGYRMGLWHSSIGYPHRVSFYQDRIIYSMMDEYPTRIETSETGNYERYAPTDSEDVTEVLDSNAISFDLPAEGTGRVQWCIGAGKNLLAATEGNVFSITGTQTSILAPGKVQSNSISSFGADNIPSIQAGGGIYYIEKGGTRLRLAASASADTFETMDMTRTNPSILDSGALGMVFAKSPFSAAWIWRTDGTAVTFTVDEQEKVYSFARHVLGGSFSTGNPVVESIGVMNSSTYHTEVWMVVKRTINSSTVRYVERLAGSLYMDYTVTQNTAVCVDSAYVYNSSAVTNVPSGALNHLIGQSVDVIADGVIVTGRTVNGSGQLDTALSTAASVIIVGLAYRPKFETTDLQQMSDKGATFGLVTRIHEADIGFYRTLGAKIGRDSSSLNEIYFGDYSSSAVSLFSGVKKESINGIHTENPRIRIEQLIPAPICITFINARGEPYG